MAAGERSVKLDHEPGTWCQRYNQWTGAHSPCTPRGEDDMPVMKGKYALTGMLQAEGVEYVFGNPGTTEMPFLQALSECPDMKYILCVQEGVAMGMADGYARASGNVGFVSLHIDSGLANGLSLLNDSNFSGTPLVVTAANKDVRKLAEGRSDLVRMCEPFTKWSAEITHAEQFPSVLRRAFSEARTPPTGPVFVGFSTNALDEEAEMALVPSREAFSAVRPDRGAIGEAAALLAGAKHPVLIVGDRVGDDGGVAEAVRVAEQTGARVRTHLGAQVNFPTGHPQFVGTFIPRDHAHRQAMGVADVVLGVGVDVFGDLVYQPGATLPASTALVHLDSNAGALGRSEPTDLAILTSPKIGLAELGEALEACMSQAERRAAAARGTAIAAETAPRAERFRKQVEQERGRDPMGVATMMSAIADALPDEVVICSDAVSSSAMVHAARKFDTPGSFYAARGGAIGWGMGMALGIQLAQRGQPVVAIVGDGTAMMTVQALWTAAVESIPVVYCICNNASYNVLKVNLDIYARLVPQEPGFQPSYLGMDFPQPFDFAALAQAFGVYGKRIEDPAEIGPELEQALGSGKPAVLDVVIDPNGGAGRC